MNFFQRAIKNVTRSKTKTLLLILTFFVIGNFVIVGLGVSNASENAKRLTRQKMRAVVTYTLDYNKIWQYADSLEDEDERNEFYNNYPRVTLSDVNEFLSDPRVKTANAVYQSQYYTAEGGIDYVHLNNDAENNQGGGQSCYIDEFGQEECYAYQEPSFFVKGNFFENMIEFEDGDYTLLEGRFYTRDEVESGAKVALITNALAEANGLHLGDSFTVAFEPSTEIRYMGDEIELTAEDLQIELEIIGIYDSGMSITPDNPNFSWTPPYNNPDNMILMPGTTMQYARLPIDQAYFDHYAEMWPEEEYYSNPDNRPSADLNKIYIDNVTLLLNDPLEVDEFVKSYSETVGQFKKLDANNDEFNKLSKPLDTLNFYANFIVWLVVINAVVIITLVTALTLKTREYEIGVLLSLGASKMKVVSQFFTELAIVALIGFSLSVVSGSLVANKVGSTVLDYQISSELGEAEDEYYWDNDYIDLWSSNYATSIELEDLVSEYNVSVSPLIIAEIYVVGLGIVFISTIIPSFMVMRYNPKRILMSQY